MVGMMGSDQYCLRWNSYETNILATFEGLLDSEALSDVTLFCEGESFRAHRLVLSACSSHFAKLFGNNTVNGQIIVILDGTRSADLQILLQFMYRGVAYLHQDRIDSVLRTAEVLQVKGLSDGHSTETVSADVNKGPREDGGAPPPEYITSPPHGDQQMKKETNDRDSRGDPPRDSSPRPSGPSGRIAVADSPLPPIPPPIFSQNYSRPPFTSIASNFYSQFGGFARPDNKPTSTSAASFVPGKNADGPGPQDRPSRDSSQYANFQPHRGERERDDPYESGSDRLELDNDPPGPPPPKRSPPRSHRLPSSSDHEQRSPRHIQSDSTTDPTSPSHRRYEEEDNRSAGRPPVLVKTENTLDGRRRSFTGELQGSREDLRTISAGSSGNPRAEDLRTNDQEQRLKQETNLETLRRIAAANSERESQLATIQKMDLLRQAQGRDPFLSPGGFQVPLTAPLGIPASDLARIACTVQETSGSGDPTTTGTKLKCPFCERTYGYETNLRAHIRQRHQGIRVPCPFCHRSFTRNNTVRRHIAREHRHQINPKMIPAKFGQTTVLPDAPFQEHLNKQAQQP